MSLIVVGVCAALAGVAAFSPRAAVIVAGVVLVFGGVMLFDDGFDR